MPHVDFIWFPRPLEKIAEHGVTRDEVEHVIRAARPGVIVKSRTSDRMTAIGYTAARRKIEVVFDWADEFETTAIPVTAYDKD
ncbi:MAG: hypothetical protein AAGG38_15385 [Planctomycetota bacterium]